MTWSSTLSGDMSQNQRPPGAPRRNRPRRRHQQHLPRPAASTAVLSLTPDDYVPTGFADLGVPERVDLGLAAAGFTTPFAIQTKAIPVALTGPRPIDEAISSAGGVRWEEIDADLMLRKLPGVFVAGEMIDWEAPTGGYLMQGCFATGTLAGLSAARHIP